MEQQRPSQFGKSSKSQRIFVVAPRSPLAKLAAVVLTLTFAVLGVLLFGVILAGAIAVAALGAVILMFKRPLPASTRGAPHGRIIEGEHTVDSIEDSGRSHPRRRR